MTRFHTTRPKPHSLAHPPALASPLHGMVLAAIFLIMISGDVAGQDVLPTMVNDLTTSPFEVYPNVSNAEAVGLNGDFYFVSNDGVHGWELWRSDGSQQGTTMVRDICPGLCSATPEEFTVIGNHLFFRAWDGETGVELWSSDGTPNGTVRVSDIWPGPGSSSPKDFGFYQGRLMFSAASPDFGRELWQSDGTLTGTLQIADLTPGPMDSTLTLPRQAGPWAIFSLHSQAEAVLYRTDGTAAGTTPVKVFQPWGISRHVGSWEVFNSTQVVFSAEGSTGDEVWLTDGTGAGTFLLSGGHTSAPGAYLAEEGNLYFRTNSVWVTDGTPGGTHRLRSQCRTSDLEASGGNVYFACRSYRFGSELWRTDGSLAGTTMIEDLPLSPGMTYSRDVRLTAVPGGIMFFDFVRVGEMRAFFTDGTPNSAQPLTVPPIDASPAQRSDVVNGRVLLTDGSVTLPHLFTTDGQATTDLGSPNSQTSSFTDFLVDVGAKRVAFLTWSPSLLGTWLLDGQQMLPLTQIDPFFESYGSGIPPGFLPAQSKPIELGGRIYLLHATFSPFCQRPISLISALPGLTDPQRLHLPGSVQVWPTLFSGKIYSRVERTCGGGGTARVEMIDPLTGAATEIIGPDPLIDPGAPNRWLDTGTELFVPSKTGVWSIDEHGQATDWLHGARNADSFSMTPDGSVFFTAETSFRGREVWSLPASQRNPRLLDLQPGPGSGVFRPPPLDPWKVNRIFSDEGQPTASYAIHEDLFLFSGDDGNSGVEVWATDAFGPPFLVSDIAEGPSSSYPQNFLRQGSRVFFRANDGQHGAELWSTEQGLQTRLVRDVRPGIGSSIPSQLQDVDGQLLFTAYTDAAGLELWGSDGTTNGTKLLSDIAPGTKSSSPSSFLITSDAILFSANDTVSGFELWSIERPIFGAPDTIFATGFETGSLMSWSSDSP